MADLKRIQFSVDIAAPASTVYAVMLGPDSFREWTSAFAEGSHYAGSWEKGQRIRFLTPSGDGMVSEIAENRPNEFVSIRHLGYINKGVDDMDSEAVREWAPSFENYTFEQTAAGTRLVVDQDVTAEFERYLAEAWPKALQRLKAMCESAQP